MNMPGMSNDHLVTADMLQHLPEPVRRYVTYTGVVGTAWINTARLKYAGKFRRGFDQPWMPMTATQVDLRQLHYTRNHLTWQVFPGCGVHERSAGELVKH